MSSLSIQGLIKIRLDPCWKDLTCMNYHYQVNVHIYFITSFICISSFFPFLVVSLSPCSFFTYPISPFPSSLFTSLLSLLPQTQPVPNPISYYLHQTPESVHKMETLANHAVELVAPFLLVLPRPIRTFGGIVQVLFQVWLLSTTIA